LVLDATVHSIHVEAHDPVEGSDSPAGGGQLRASQAYLLAVVATAATLASQLALVAQMAGQRTFVIFMVPIMLSAYVGGLRAGLLATVTAFAGACYYLLPPIHSFAIDSNMGRWQLFFLAVAGVFTSVLSESLHRARRRANLATRRHRVAEERVRVSEAALSRSVQRLNEAQRIGKIGDWERDLTTDAVSWSPQVFEILGRDPLLGPPRHSAEAIAMYDAASQTLLEQKVNQAIATGEPQDYELVALRPDGARVHVHVRTLTKRDESGRVTGFLGTVQDITERKMAEAGLQQRDSLLHVAGRVAHFGGWSVNLADGKHVWSDEVARIHDEPPGYAPAVSDGINYYAPEFRQKITTVFGDCARDGTPFDEEMQIVTARGRRVWVRAVGEAVRNAAGVIVCVQGAFQDITERVRTDEQLRRMTAELEDRVLERTAQLQAANQELEAFSYSVSHDLRSPLRAVDGFAQAVLEDFGPQLPADGRRQLQVIRDSAQNMGALIDDLLRLSRLSRTPLAKQECDTGMLVRDVLEDIVRQHEGRRVELRIGKLPSCTGDPALLRQVWVNLLSNAFKYTQKREAALVEVGCEARPDGSVYFVRDNGAGFDMRYASKLFGVFQRLHRAEDYEGTGVGLAIVQRVVNRHGGRIWAEASVDRGATFYFTLPEDAKS
jgi:PAS domain S-box-containing protein